MWSHALEKLKDEWNNDRVSQDIFSMQWAIGERVAELQDYVLNFLWTYGKISEDGEAISVPLRYIVWISRFYLKSLFYF